MLIKSSISTPRIRKLPSYLGLTAPGGGHLGLLDLFRKSHDLFFQEIVAANCYHDIFTKF